MVTKVDHTIETTKRTYVEVCADTVNMSACLPSLSSRKFVRATFRTPGHLSIIFDFSVNIYNEKFSIHSIKVLRKETTVPATNNLQKDSIIG